MTDKLGENLSDNPDFDDDSNRSLLLQPMILIQILMTVWTMLTMVLLTVVGQTGAPTTSDNPEVSVGGLSLRSWQDC